MKKIAIILALMALAVTGCQKEGQKNPAANPQQPQNGMPQVPPGTDPHAGMKPQEIPAGTGHTGKVTQILDAGPYNYIEVAEGNQKIWVAVMKDVVTKEGVKVGDTIEFPDAPPLTNWQSQELKRTFDKVIMVPGIRKDNK
ncbi:MAG: hypothetical protein FWD70_07465 [Desulfuromonadales bacterium]|nr:hypothetical protein [Desulfuromonadales bacterium]